VYSLAGGTGGWAEAGLPVVSGSEATGAITEVVGPH